MRNIEHVEGVVLKKKLLLEKDYLVTVFTKENGKSTGFAKGARKLTSRRAAHLQTGNLIVAQLSKKSDVIYFQSTDLISGFMNTRGEGKSDYLYAYLYILDRILPENQSESGVYNILLKFLIKLSDTDLYSDYSKIFHNALQLTLMELGFVDGQLSVTKLINIVEENINQKLFPHVII